MKFWEKHSEEMRKARLLQASAIIHANTRASLGAAVDLALILEAEINKRLRDQKGEQNS